MFYRIQSKPARVFGGRIAQTVRHYAVRNLMNYHGEQKRDKLKNQNNKIFHLKLFFSYSGL
jgi:hypothetical protein